MVMHEVHAFRRKLRDDYDALLKSHKQPFPDGEILKIDLHCHDCNSDVPDELWGRILRLPETWLKTADLIRCLESHGAGAVTVTNHNNARSCWDLAEKGHDVLPGAEFTCHFPEFQVSIHVLTFGFNPQQEEILKQKRRNIYKFLEYTTEHDLPTVLPHPLYFYSPKFRPPPSLFEKFALMFERFEVLNGQRDLWQNLLAWSWLESVTPEKLEAWGRKHGIRPDTFCRDPYHKRVTGGSDDHMGLLAGSSGTHLYVPDLARRLRTEKPSRIALEGLRTGATAPYGCLGEEEKLNVAFLDYICQIAMNMEDPGLLRMFLHQGTLKDKLMCLAIGNGFHELRRHRYTMRFFKVFHEALRGKRPSWVAGFRATRDYKPLIAILDRVARAKKQGVGDYVDTLRESIPGLFSQFNRILANRMAGRRLPSPARGDRRPDPGDLIRRIELPSHLRFLFSGEGPPLKQRNMTRLNLSQVFDNLSFPALASLLVAGSAFTSSKVFYNNRPFLNQFAAAIDNHRHPKRALWLTDTFTDCNGVSFSLKATLKEVVKKDLPIDFLVCHDHLKAGDHLRVLKPVGEFVIPGFGEHTFRVPDLLEVQRIFREGGYDRIICSTEFLMAPVALYLKAAYSVPAYFFMHTDWLDFLEKNTDLDLQAMDRVRRILRGLYRQFAGIFVLNSEHRDWLAGSAMGIPTERIHETAHWTEDCFWPKPQPKTDLFAGVAGNAPLLLYAGRLSAEKGVLELPSILKTIRMQHPGVRLVIAGTGPEEAQLKKAMPGEIFMGWVAPERLPEIYSSADLLIMPSRFDTFGRVVLEALSCGLPVAAYDTKGPRDIIVHGTCGFLASDKAALAENISQFFSKPWDQPEMKRAAFLRGGQYRAEDIMSRFVRNLGLEDEESSGRLTLKLRTEFEETTTPEPSFFEEILEMVNVH